MGKLSERCARVRQARVEAAQDLEHNQKVSKALDEANKYLAKTDRKRANAKIATVKKLLAAQYSEQSLDTWCKALRHPKRFHWEKGANEKEEVPASQVAAERGLEPDAVWHVLAPSSGPLLGEPGVTAREAAREDRALNLLDPGLKDELIPATYREYCCWRMAKSLVRLLVGSYREPNLGEQLIHHLMGTEQVAPTTEHAQRFIRTRGASTSEPRTFLEQLFADVPGAKDAVDLLLAIYNVLVRAESFQQHANSKKRAKRNKQCLPQLREPILPSTKTEHELGRASTEERLQFAILVSEYLFGCGPDHLASALSVPQKRLRNLIDSQLHEDRESCLPPVVTKVEDDSLPPDSIVKDHGTGGFEGERDGTTYVFADQPCSRSVA